jgi:hypothetical protein
LSKQAWYIDADGLVVDTVLDEYQTDYVGVAFNTAFMKRWTASRNVYGVLAEMFPPELADMAPADFLAKPTPAQIAAADDVLARVRKLLAARSTPPPDHPAPRSATPVPRRRAA